MQLYSFILHAGVFGIISTRRRSSSVHYDHRTSVTRRKIGNEVNIRKHLKLGPITLITHYLYRIRIHVPVKHHTHYHTRTKTVVKEVHVPPPPKKSKKPHEEHHNHHVPKHSHHDVDLHLHSGPAPSAPAKQPAYQPHLTHQQKRLADLFDDADIAEELGFTAEELDDLYPQKSSKSKKQRQSAKSAYYK